MANINIIESEDLTPRLQTAINQIAKDYGDEVYIKEKSLSKYGRTINADSGVWTTVMELPGATQYHETYITDNSNGIDSIVSSSGSDTGTYNIEGHTNDGSGNLTFITQNVTLTGQTPVTLTTALNRVSRIQPVATNTTALVGNVQIYESTGATVTAGVVSPDTLVHMQSLANNGETSQKAATSFSSVDYGILTHTNLTINKGSGSAVADMRIMIRQNPNSVFRQVGHTSTVSQNQPSRDYVYDPCIIIPKNYDIRLEVQSDTANTKISAGFGCYLAKVKA